MNDPAVFIESKKYVSWERFFTKLLRDETKDTYLAYKKDKLNPAYLHDRNKELIMRGIETVSGGKLI